LKAELRDELDDNEYIKQKWGVMKFIASQYADMLEWVDYVEWDEEIKKKELKLKMLKAMGKVVWLEDNPKITIIQNAVPKMDRSEILL
jgi:hypothetical protein